MFSFEDKVVLLTGATGGLGRRMAQRLHERGAKLVVTGRTLSELEALIDELGAGDDAFPVDGTLTEPGEAERLAREAETRWGRVDVLVNNAGMSYFALVEEATSERVRELFELNTFAPLTLMRHLVPGMKERAEGRIVNIASAAGRVPIPTVGIYGGSKSALAILARTLRFELGPSGVRVINVYPGTAATAFEVNAFRERGRQGLDPEGRYGRDPDEIADEVVEAIGGVRDEVWLEREGRRMSLLAEVWPRRVEKRLEPLRDQALHHAPGAPKPLDQRRWRLWQVESAVACNLRCVMCPWQDERERAGEAGVMSEEVWDAIRPHLPEIATVDFTGGGEPLLNPALPERVAEAKSQGCRVGFLTNATELRQDAAAMLMEAGVDWITISIDGPTKESYEQVRLGADFDEVVSNVRGLVALRGAAKSPVLGVNFVMMPSNVHLLEAMVRFVADLGVDKLIFKQADVVRGEHGEGYGLYARGKSERRSYEKALARAVRLARRLGLESSTFAFEPDEQPVCEQDPRTSIFVRYDGRMSPCINLAYGGPTTFLGQPATLPSVHYGRLPDDDPLELWESDPTCRTYRDTFGERVRIFDETMFEGALDSGISRLERAEKRAHERMPAAPRSCRQCHYLYDV